MSSFHNKKSTQSHMRKMRLLPEDDYQNWRAHKCNENQVEKVDMLNKKYCDTISSDNLNVESENNNAVASNENMTNKIADTVADTTVSNDNASQNVSNVAEDTIPNLDETLHEQGDHNTKNLEQEFQNTNIDSPPASTSLAPPPSPATRSPNVYNCTPQGSEHSPSSRSTSVIQSRQKSKPQTKFAPYKCSVCFKDYTSKWNLNRHLRKIHSKQLNHSKHSTDEPTEPTPRNSGAYPVLIETNPPLSDDEENLDVSKIPLPSDDDDAEPFNFLKNNFEQFSPKTIAQKKKKSNKNELPPFNLQQFPQRTIAQKRKTKTDLQMNTGKQSKFQSPKFHRGGIVKNSNLKKKRTTENDDDVLETRTKRKGSFKGTYGSGSRFYYSWD